MVLGAVVSPYQFCVTSCSSLFSLASVCVSSPWAAVLQEKHGSSQNLHGQRFSHQISTCSGVSFNGCSRDICYSVFLQGLQVDGACFTMVFSIGCCGICLGAWSSSPPILQRLWWSHCCFVLVFFTFPMPVFFALS